MGKEKYDLLMGEMDNILEKVEKSPDSVRKSVFKALHSVLMDGDIHGKGAGKSDIESPQLSNGDSPSDKSDDEDRNYAEEIANYAKDYNLSDRRKVNDMEFAAFVAYYFTECAPEDEKVDAITKKHLEDTITIVGRNMPKNINATLSGAANRRGYLKSLGNGKYELTANGKHFVKNTLLKSDN